MLFHRRHLLLVEVFFTLTDDLHDLERRFVLDPFEDQIVHDVVTSGNDLTHRRRPGTDVVLRVVQPYVCTVRKSGNAHQIGEFIRFRIVQHLPGKRGSELRDRVGAVLEFIVRVLDIQRFDAVEDTQHLAVCQVDLQRVGTRHILQLTDHGRHIVAEDIQLEQVFIDLMIIKVRGHDIGRGIVGRVLYRTEFIDLVIVRTDDDAARMLTGRTLDAGAVLRQTVLFIFVDRDIPFLKKLRYIAKGRLFGDRADGPGLKNILFAEDSPDIAMRDGLVFSGEVQVDIRLFVALEPQERRERDRIAVPLHRRAAVRAVHRRHIHAAVVFLHIAPDDLLAVRAQIMRIQRIDFRNARHRRRERRADRPSGTDQITVRQRFVHQHLRADIHDRVAVVDDGVQLDIQTFFDLFGQRVAVLLMRALHTGLAQRILCALDLRRELSGRYRTDTAVDQARDIVGIVHHDFLRPRAQIRKFFHHFVGGLHVQALAALRVLKAHAGHDDVAVDRVIRFRIVRVRRRHHPLAELVRQRQDPLVDLADIVLTLDPLIVQIEFFFHHKAVVDDRLDLQIIITGSDALLLFR